MKLDEVFAKVENTFWTGADIVADYVHKQLYLLGVLLFLGVVGVSLGVWVSYFGLTNLSSATITFGKVITGFSSILATMMALYIMNKNAAVLYGGAILNRIVSNVVRQASRPLPSTAIEIDQYIETEDIKKFLIGFGGGYAILAFLGYIALAFPVYTLPAVYFSIIVGAVFLGFAAATWGLAGPWVERFQKGSMAFVIIMMLLSMVLFFVPNPVKRWQQNIMLDEVLFQEEQKNVPVIQAKVEQLQREINSDVNNSTLNGTQKAVRILEKRNQIDFYRNSTGSPSWNFDLSTLPRWAWVLLMIAGLVLVLAVFKKIGVSIWAIVGSLVVLWLGYNIIMGSAYFFNMH